MAFAALVASLFSTCQGQFSPSFAVSQLPVQLSFPQGFVSQSLFPLMASAPIPKSKKGTPGIHNPNPLPPDPAANQALTNLLTSAKDKKIDGKKSKEIKALFDQDSFRSYNIEMSPLNIGIISQDPTEELKVHCRVTTDYNTPQAKVFNDFALGCGYKGSVGSLRVCLDEYHKDNKICRKLSLRVDARAFNSKVKVGNKTVSAPLIHGMRTLEFAGMPVDLSMVSERTAYYLMKSFDMEAPMAVHAKVFLNGKYLGIYALIQSVDQEFTKVEFDKDGRKGGGGLYKEQWFNNLHMADLDKTYVSGARDDAFLREVMSAITSTPLTGNAPQQFFDKYMDTKSLIDLTAFNTVIGDTDDWRQRHNFFLYVKQDKSGNKKLVWIPWDYDRLYDAGSETRGALRGKAWWDISGSATPAACNQEIRTAQQQADALGGTPEKVIWNRGIFEQFPLDINVPVTCDKLTQLMAAALGSKIRARTREFANKLDMNKVRSLWNKWNAQIKTAVEKDPSGPSVGTMLDQQSVLAQHLTQSIQRAINEANLADGISSFGSSPFAGASSFSGTTSFAPPAFSSSTSFSPASSFTPKPSFPAAAPAAPATSLRSLSLPAASSSTSFSSFRPASTSFSSFPGSTFPASTSTFSSSFTPFSPQPAFG